MAAGSLIGNAWSVAILASLAGGLFVAGTAAAQSSPPGAPVACRIEVSDAGGLLRLQAIGRAETAISGRYAFTVRKRNAGGSTDNNQSGTFMLAPRHDRVLTTVMLEAAVKGHYAAHLSLAEQRFLSDPLIPTSPHTARSRPAPLRCNVSTSQKQAWRFFSIVRV